MNVGQLKRLLANIPEDTTLVRFHRPGEAGAEGYDDVWFDEGTHKYHEDDDSPDKYMVPNRAKWVKGQAKPDYLPLHGKKSRSKNKTKYLLLY